MNLEKINDLAEALHALYSAITEKYPNDVMDEDISFRIYESDEFGNVVFLALAVEGRGWVFWQVTARNKQMDELVREMIVKFNTEQPLKLTGD